jgi:ABC-type phosphate transport system permease subunit
VGQERDVEVAGAVGLTLFVATLVMNIIANRLVKRFREVYE